MPPRVAGFDAAAARYDDDEAGNAILRHMRERSLENHRLAFGRGARLLELGSGTGTEASRLARELECTVALLDPSTHLLEVAAAKLRSIRPSALAGAHELPGQAVGSLVDHYGRASFDGAYSSFGALNCEPSLVPVASGLAALVRPGGRVVLSIINRWCPGEVAWYALHGELGEATRRWGGPVLAAAYPHGPKDVRTFYYSLREIRRAFVDGFVVEHAEALPLLLPPPYLDFLARKSVVIRKTFHAVEGLDRWASRQPVLRNLGDHVLVRLRRR